MGHNRAGDKVRKSERRRRRELLRLSRKAAGAGQAPGPVAKVKKAVGTTTAAVGGFVEGVVSGFREGVAKAKPEKVEKPKAEKPKAEKPAK